MKKKKKKNQVVRSSCTKACFSHDYLTSYFLPNLVSLVITEEEVEESGGM